MNAEFQRLMQDATRLTQSGDLAAATAAIQAALAREPDGSAGDAAGDVIDVEAREVPDELLAIASDVPVPVVAPDEQPVPHRDEAFVAGSFGTGAIARDYKLYVPPASGTQPLPLIVMLHGCTQNPDDFAAGTAMNEAARDAGFFVLYPAQSQKANPQRCWNWFKHNHQVRGRGEPAILASLTLEVIARYGIDPARVYVAGLSAGGAMAAILAQAYPDIFAAAGVHSGLPHGAARDLPSALQAMKNGRGAAASSGATPIIVFHGDADPTVHPRNGETVFAMAGGGGTTVRTETGGVPGGRAWTRHVKTAADGTVRAEHWQVHGAAHAWCGGSARGSYTDPQGPDATREMIRFFRSHTLRR
ncbi:extracellular catalytic domain type 1 short-chain-length polyhydroxyalkanoate depolymerase [Ramlibacter sp. PS4R-6]|uniref:extracellular catalytic domain type 1 short-chain-length polyhydroxyalkanoate depolymerase n=1 Tax=Ramlibacter sp. PS4R-6 TaxID=3133438 RepID=UPI00309606B2